MIVIWRGFGILIIPVFGLAMILGLVTGAAFKIPGGFVLGFALAALLNAAIWQRFGPKPRLAGSPPPLQAPRRHSLFFIPAKAWTWIFALMILPAIGLEYLAASADRELAATPGYAEFKAADDKIFSAKSGTAHGNNAQAIQAAEDFSKQMRMTREIAFSGGSKKPLLTQGQFLTYCHQGKDTVLFLCHVPDLRKYADADTKNTLVEIAWAMARTIAPHLGNENPRVVVGLRGVTTYGFILHGQASDETPARADSSGRPDMLFRIFAETAPVAALTPPTPPSP
ncbi:hypothetical protein [Haloferula sp. BvORR071]|uniref:hypothetical protein n=1 Tax=Haloferula sp. BvORR071 TaxID=1396141 RepID=UPI00054E9421|nr:hypothetical protein [Haloferula sp. BvORR071]